MSPRAGSYETEAVDGEARRLREQAAAIWGREREALLRAGLGAGLRFLDLGCGPGGILERVGADLGRSPFGVDVSHEFLRRAGAVAQVARADGGLLPFRDGVFDFVLMRLVLRHAPSRVRLLHEAARVVRVGGRVCAVDVDEEATSFDPEPGSWPALKRALGASAIRRGGDPFVGRRLRRLLLEAGLVDPVVTTLAVTTDDLAPRAFLETMLAPAARVVDPDLMTALEVGRGWEELRQWAAAGAGFGYALGLMAAARKPDGWNAGALP